MTANTSPLDIRGHTVRRDGEIVATLTYSGGYTVVRVGGTVAGRAYRVQKDPDRYYAWDACNPVIYVMADNRLTDAVPYETAIAAIIWRHEQEARIQTTIETRESRNYPGGTTLVTGRGNGENHTEVTLADLREMVTVAQARIEQLTKVATDD